MRDGEEMRSSDTNAVQSRGERMLRIKKINRETLYILLSLPCYIIISLFKSFTTIYLPIPIHPHRNHLIWLLCAFTIALCPLFHCPKSLTNSRLGGSSFLFLCAIPAALQPPNTIVTGASMALMYFRKILVVVRVYNSTGHFQPDFPAISEDSQCRAPWYREIWLGWDDIPRESNVIKVSMVEVGSSDDELFFEELEAGLKAEESIWAILSAGQVVVMLSGNFGSSITRTSEAERRPSIVPEAASSCLRISPRPSAFPVYGTNQHGNSHERE